MAAPNEKLMPTMQEFWDMTEEERRDHASKVMMRYRMRRFDECHGGGTGYAATRRKARATERLAAALHRGSARMASELTTGAHVERTQCAPALPQPARQASGDAGGV